MPLPLPKQNQANQKSSGMEMQTDTHVKNLLMDRIRVTLLLAAAIAAHKMHTGQIIREFWMGIINRCFM